MESSSNHLPGDAQPLDPAGKSLIVKLTHSYCAKCTEIPQKWCEPVKPYSYADGRINVYDSGYRYTIDADYFLREQNRRATQWVWFISDLKTSAKHCRCCNFILESLNASPWMAYEDEDFILLKSQLVGSKHSSGTLATPFERNRFHSQFEYGNGRSQNYSEYDRYHRPMIMLYNKKKEKKDDRGTHWAGDVTFILPLAQSESVPSGNKLPSETFYGRIVTEKANLQLIQQWFGACCKEHVTSEKPVHLQSWEEQKNGQCIPALRRKIDHFRLIDVKKRCVVLAQDQDEYAALSYVWGQAKRLLLTTANLEQLSTPGAFSDDNDEVPKTFKDAIYVAEKLNLAFLWVDAVCVLQDDEEQLVDHMNVMDAIYSSATLTIVSDADNADSGIPGISAPRGPQQATFKYGNTTYISAKRTFGKALGDSCWESRAWCLQEKVFSRRLLVFSPSQAYYHCASTTWFEDTIMEPKEKNYGVVSIAERESASAKSVRGPEHTAYEAHRKMFNRNFCSLIEVYTRRQLSFESDSIRAFSGILASMESEYGPPHWGIPEYSFTRCISFTQSPSKVENRRPGFPSWSWAGWRGNKGSPIHFGNMKTHLSDIWNIDWHFHKLNEQTGAYELTPMLRAYRHIRGAAYPNVRRPKHEAQPRQEVTVEQQAWDPYGSFWTAEELGSLSNPSTTEKAGAWKPQFANFKPSRYGWRIPGHPGEEDYTNYDMPAFKHDANTMPPLSHIIRFYTSCATVFIDAEPDPEYGKFSHYSNQDEPKKYYTYRSPTTKSPLGHFQLDPEWKGKGREQELVYISTSFYPPTDSMMGGWPTLLWVMLVESLEGAPEVKRRVQLCGPVEGSKWELAEPVWKCVNLA